MIGNIRLNFLQAFRQPSSNSGLVMAQTNNEPPRIPSPTLLKAHLLDPVLYLITVISYSLSILLAKNVSCFTFIFVFGLSFWLLNSHVESYRSFKLVRRCIRELSRNKQAMRAFLSVHMNHKFFLDYQTDTFRWANRLIASFWPHVSHVVHFELNEFIRKSKSFSKPGASKTKRLLYAIGRQIDANIMAIEHCQLGARAPYIKCIKVLVDYEESLEQSDVSMSLLSNQSKLAKFKSRMVSDKLLVYDLDLAYEGNMNISFIYRYLCCCSSRLGLRDVFIHFRSRLAVGPIHDNVLKLDKLTFSLLELPEFGYKGIAIVELARLKVARRSINRLIKEHLLYPKFVTLGLGKTTSGDGAPGSQKNKFDHESDLDRYRRMRSKACSEPEVPFRTRILAKFLVCSCLCTNCCLKWCCCQCNKDDS